MAKRFHWTDAWKTWTESPNKRRLPVKKGKIGLLLLCFILCLSVVCTAAAETPLSAKQLILNKLKNWDAGPAAELYNTSSGTVSYTVKELDGMLVSAEPLKSLAGAQLKLKHEFLASEEKLAAEYELTLKQGQYRGDIYLDSTRLILSPDVLSLVKLFDPEYDMGAIEHLPEYLFLSEPETAQIWDNMAVSSGQEIPPELRELLVFFVEAVPGQYFTTSLINQRVTFSLDQEGLEDVLLQILQKIKNEDERFAELIAGLLAAYAPGEDKADIKREILDSLEKSIQDGSFNESEDEIQELLKNVTINQLSYEIPLLPGGESEFNLDLALDTGGGAAASEAEAWRGGVKVKALTSGPSDNRTGAYTIVFDNPGKPGVGIRNVARINSNVIIFSTEDERVAVVGRIGMPPGGKAQTAVIGDLSNIVTLLQHTVGMIYELVQIAGVLVGLIHQQVRLKYICFTEGK
jgi:hypothetical protein